MTATVLAPRPVFRTDRSLEFFTARELTTQTGHEPGDWPLVVFKELVDNALDACEEAGVAPEITVTVDAGCIQVADTGPGIPPEAVRALPDYRVRISSREAWVSPSRGQQGNALKTVLAMPIALGAEESVVEIASRGVRHEIRLSVDRIGQRPVVRHVETPDPVRTGTTVRVRWPERASYMLRQAEPRFLHQALGFQWLNPHLAMDLSWFADRFRTQATDPGWTKWRPSDPTCPIWYDIDELERLIVGYLAHDRDLGQTRSVGELLATFRGLTGTGKRRAILERTGLSRVALEDLVVEGSLDRSRMSTLLQAMHAAVLRPVKPEMLGVLGEEHLRTCLGYAGCDHGSVRYRAAKGTTSRDRPYFLEVAFGYAKDRGKRLVISGVNWTPGIRSPFPMLGEQLEDLWAGEDSPVVLAVHLATPRVDYQDRGKGSAFLPAEIRGDLDRIVESVTKAWTKQARAEDRSESARLRREEKLAPKRTAKEALNAAAWEVIPEAYAKASSGGTLPALARQIMYAARGPIQDRAGEPLGDAYFTQRLLPDFMTAHPEETAGWDVVWDSRGTLHEPHTGVSVPLGTIAVREYLRTRPSSTNGSGGSIAFNAWNWIFPTSGPRNRYRAILFLEKEGFLPLLQRAQIAERYDVSIMSTKGMSTTAARLLVDTICRADCGVPLLVLRDFDKSGFSIAATIQKTSRRYRFKHAVTVVDLGLRLDDVKEWALASEAVEFNKKLKRDPRENLRKNGATEEEIAFLVESGPPYRGKRVELNAFTSGDFIKWIEGKIAQHLPGDRKLVPADDVLADAFGVAVERHVTEHLLDEVRDRAREEAARVTVPEDLRERVRGALSVDTSEPWDAIVMREAYRRLLSAETR